MKTETSNLKRLDIVGNGDSSSERDVLTAMLKQWRQKLGYCSIFAAVPAILASHISEARSDEAKKPEASVAGRVARRLEKLNTSISNPALLKRQSEFRLPHQKGSFALLASFAGKDDCPGLTIPEGTYTAAAPYTDSGDTTGANNTVTSFYMYSFGYLTVDSLGPDHVYSFTLTGRGPNPQIEVSTASGTYRPLIYVLEGGYAGACPAGTGKHAYNGLMYSPSSPAGTATINSQLMNRLPLNVPLYLFVDSNRNDASGSGAYSIQMQDVTTAPAACTDNPINCPEFFVRRHYLDFLNREPDPAGFGDWVGVLNGCGTNQGGLGSPIGCDRVHVSSGFYRSPEFTDRGYLIYRFYEAALGRLPKYTEFITDLASLSGASSPAEEQQRIATLLAGFMARQEFTTKYPGLATAATAEQFVARLEELARVTLPETIPPPRTGQPPQFTRAQLVQMMRSGQKSPAETLRAFIEQQVVYDRFFFRGFVAMQYFGYLRRDPEQAGYDDWVDVLTNGRGTIAPRDYRHMIFGFIYSEEYRKRFSPS